MRIIHFTQDFLANITFEFSFFAVMNSFNVPFQITRDRITRVTFETFSFLMINYFEDVVSISIFDQRFDYNIFTLIISLFPMDSHDVCFQILFLENLLLQILQMLFFFWSWTHENSFILIKLFFQMSHLNSLFFVFMNNFNVSFQIFRDRLSVSLANLFFPVEN